MLSLGETLSMNWSMGLSISEDFDPSLHCFGTISVHDKRKINRLLEHGFYGTLLSKLCCHAVKITNCHQTRVGWLKLMNLQCSCYYIFVSFRNKVNIIVHYTTTPHSASMLTLVSMTLNARFNLMCNFQMTCITYVCCGYFQCNHCVMQLLNPVYYAVL